MDSRDCHICKLPLARSTPSHHHECPFCGHTFRRVDGAKRHTKTCRSRGDRPLTPYVKRGRKVHACDACSRVKVSCDSKAPCTRCASRDLSCTYRRICTDPSHLSRPTTLSEEQHVSTDDDGLALPFLLACTDPSIGPVDEVILTRELEHSPAPLASWEASDNDHNISDTIDPRLLYLNFIYPSFGMEVDCNGLDDNPIPGTSDPLDELGISDEELQTQLSLLEVEIGQVAAAQPRIQNLFGTPSWAGFFAISSFRESMKIFFQKEQLLATIIHKPTFDPHRVDPALLLSIAVSGYTYLHCRQGGMAFSPFALALREIGEHYIFRRVEQLPGSTAALAMSGRVLEICQAAYIIETLQFSVKDAETRQHLITKSHPMLVDAMRNLKMTGSRHQSPASESEWHTFVYRESCIRLLHWVFINDAWFTLFSNHPPAMTFFDVSGHLPCGDVLWNADSPASFDTLRFQQDFSTGLPCLKSLISGLLEDEWIGGTMASYQQLDIKHFLIMILAFEHLIFHHHSLTIAQNGSSVLLRGLDRWSQLWDDALGRLSADERNALGLVKYSTELAFLFRRIIELGRAEDGKELEYLQRRVTYDTGVLHHFIRQCTTRLV